MTLPRPQLDFDGHFYQPKDAYRFSADSLLLAKFAAQGVMPGMRVADFGAGCGVVGLSLLSERPGVASVFFIERESLMLVALKQNVELYQQNNSAKLKVLASDWRELQPKDSGGPLDYIVVNPPYYPLQSSRPGRSEVCDRAKREVDGTLAELVASLGRFLGHGGRVSVAIPYFRLAELLSLWDAHNFRETRREIHHSSSGQPRLALVEAEMF